MIELVAFLDQVSEKFSLYLFTDGKLQPLKESPTAGSYEFSIGFSRYIAVWGENMASVNMIIRRLEYLEYSLQLERTEEEWGKWTRLHIDHSGIPLDEELQ